MSKDIIKINNYEISGVYHSIVASGFPMSDEPEVYDNTDLYEKDLKRFRTLKNARSGSGHDCFLKGIGVQFDLTAPEYFWRQLDRYHFIDHVSSQSKMHCITKFKIEDMVNDAVDERIIDVLKEKINAGLSHREILSNVPGGLMMTSRMTTNLLQLKTIREQRASHRLPEWTEFCKFIDAVFNAVEESVEDYVNSKNINKEE